MRRLPTGNIRKMDKLTPQHSRDAVRQRHDAGRIESSLQGVWQITSYVSVFRSGNVLMIGNVDRAAGRLRIHTG